MILKVVYLSESSITLFIIQLDGTLTRYCRSNILNPTDLKKTVIRSKQALQYSQKKNLKLTAANHVKLIYKISQLTAAL